MVPKARPAPSRRPRREVDCRHQLVLPKDLNAEQGAEVDKPLKYGGPRVCLLAQNLLQVWPFKTDFSRIDHADPKRGVCPVAPAAVVGTVLWFRGFEFSA